MEDRTQRRRAGVLAATSYVVLALLVMTDHWGRTTDDTRLELTTDPTRWLSGTFSLWNPKTSLGELQNQAYGYLWPQGPFFAGGHLLGVPAWVTERAWSTLLLVLACEGLRRVALALEIDPWGCLVAGLAYGLNAHVVAELGVRSAEVVPAVLLPWALLPLVLAVAGRMRQRWAAVCSAAVVGCFGGVNATVTAAPVALLVVVVVWAVARRHLSWRFAAAWTAGLVAATAWWGTSLLLLGRYSPPFFDYVEDAPVTTGTTGFSASLRGASNWVDYLTVAGHEWWPAGYLSAYSPFLVLVGGLVAALGVVGLLLYRGLFRAPLLIATALGLACLVAAHTGPLDSPLSPVLQDLLDGVLAPLRNVSKADPVLRVPLCLGLGVLLAHAGSAVARALAAHRDRVEPGRRPRLRRALRVGAAGGLVAVLVASVVGLSYPLASAQTRTPGWTAIPAYWQQTADYLDARSTGGATWVVPGAGFAIESWGWSLEEPIEALATSPTVTRSQVPLTPPATIRMLSSLEDYLSSGSGSPYLAAMLRRIGVDRIVVRHDLDSDTSEATPAVLVSEALARSPGLRRVATFGQLSFGPAIEVYEVRTADGAPPADHVPVSIGDVDDTVTVASSVDDAQAAIGAGLVAADQPLVVAGDDPTWNSPVDVVGDRFRMRERNFGRVDQSTSNVMAPDDPYRLGRTVPDYPGPPGAVRIAARYAGIAGITASSSQGYADVIGPIIPADAPWSVLDGDPSTAWRPAPFTDPRGQWIDIDLGRPRPVGRVTLQEDRSAVGVQPVQRWRLTAGDRTVDAVPDAYSGHVTVDLHGVVAQHLRIEVAATADDHTPVALAEVHLQGVVAHRTLPVPEAASTVDHPDYLFSAQAESRACVATLLGPDCDLLRQAASEESTGIDRTITVPTTGTWRVRGLVVSRSDPGTASLLQPLGGPTVTASSVLADDPGVSARLAYDGSTTTSWLADPRDVSPTLSIDLGRREKVSRIAVTPPTGIGLAPTDLVIKGGGQTRAVSVNGATSRFAPLQARRLTVTLVHPGPRPPGLHPLGVAELRLGPARLTTPLDGATPTGAVCGLGPHLVVDGRVLPTEVSGFVGAVVGNGQLSVRACGGPVTLTAGQHEVRLKSTHTFQPVAFEFDATGATGTTRAVPVSSRTATQLSGTDTRRVVRVTPGDDAVLSLPQSYNVGWRAEVDGTTLQPLQVDGWAQGWLVPSGTSGDVVLTFTPQRPYVVLLLIGLVLLGALLLAGLVGSVLTLVARRRPATTLRPRSLAGDPEPTSPTSRHRARRPRARFVFRSAALVVLAGAVGGPVVAAGALLGVLLGARPRLAAWAAGLLLAGAAIAVAVQQQEQPAYPWDAADLVSGAGVALALAAAATTRRPRTRGAVRHARP